MSVLTPGLTLFLLFLLVAVLGFVSWFPGERPGAREVFGTHPSAIKTLAFRSDGGALAVGGFGGAVGLWDTATRQGRVLRPPHSRSFGMVAFSPDLATAAVGERDRGVTVFDVRSGRTLPENAEDLPSCQALAFAPDGMTHALGQVDGTVIVMTSGQGRTVLGSTPAEVSLVSFAPDGSTLAVADIRGTIVVWDVFTGERRGVFAGQRRAFSCLAVAPGGKQLAATAPTLNGLMLFDLETRQERMVTPSAGGLRGAVAYSPDGQTLAISRADGAIALCDPATGQPRAILRGHHGLVWALAFSPDSRRLASGGDDQEIRLWDVATSSSP